MRTRVIGWGLMLVVLLGAAGGWEAAEARPEEPEANIYYVSSSSGDDSNSGLSAAFPFATVNKVNTLNLLPGDQVLFKCGDTWRAEPLVFSKSGTQVAPIEFNSYPAGCANKPVLSGARAITGWVLDSENVYRADLPEGTFPLGVNQLFRSGTRLTPGRWPNLDEPEGGYAFIDTHPASSNQFVDNALPEVDWTGAAVHLRNIRWSIVNRQVISSSSPMLTLNEGVSCLVSSWDTCQGWGYFINNSRHTLDQDGEWFYDASTHQVYLYSTQGTPVGIEGSVVLAEGDNVRSGGVMLSNGAATAYIILDNFTITRWFNYGIDTPGGMNGDIYHHITVRNVTIQDVDAAGVNLSSWLEHPSNGRKGLRGGHHMVFTDNIIDGANSFGITGYFAASTFEHNTIRNIGLIKNLGEQGMGCGFTALSCTENGDGLRIRLYDERDSGYKNVVRYNTFEKTGYVGVDVFGPDTVVEKNSITQACFTKADCGAIRTFGSGSLDTTPVYDVELLQNVIYDIPGNVDGCEASREAFGMGIYIDNYSRNVTVRGNTVISTTATGVLYQHSTGQASENTVFNASTGSMYAAQLTLVGSETRVSLDHNALYGLTQKAWTIYTSGLNNILSTDLNYLFHPYVTRHVAYGPTWTRMSFAEWQAFSGQELHSKTNWFTQPAGEASRGKVFYNPAQAAQMIDLGSRQYLDLDQHPVMGMLLLPPFTSVILVDNGAAPVSLHGLAPAFSEVTAAADFTLSVYGSGFTPTSVVLWNGSERPTTWVNSTHLAAAVSAADVSALGDYPVTVLVGDRETAAAYFHVVEEVINIWLPLVVR